MDGLQERAHRGGTEVFGGYGDGREGGWVNSDRTVPAKLATDRSRRTWIPTSVAARGVYGLPIARLGGRVRPQRDDERGQESLLVKYGVHGVGAFAEWVAVYVGGEATDSVPSRNWRAAACGL